MTPLAAAVMPSAHSNLPALLEISFQILVLLCFIRVAAYATRKIQMGKLIDNGSAPVRWSVPGFTGWAFIASVLLLILSGTVLFEVLVIAGVAIFLLHDQHTAEEQFGLDKLSPWPLLKWGFLIWGAVVFVEVPLTQVIDAIMSTIHLPHPEQQSVEEFRRFNTPSLIAAFMLQAVLISPMIEEIFFRGFLFTFLKNYTTTWPALFLSAGVFAFVHLNFGSVLPLWLLGIVLGIAYEHTGSLLLPIGIHACWNLVTALSLLLDKGSGPG